MAFVANPTKVSFMPPVGKVILELFSVCIKGHWWPRWHVHGTQTFSKFRLGPFITPFTGRCSSSPRQLVLKEQAARCWYWAPEQARHKWASVELRGSELPGVLVHLSTRGSRISKTCRNECTILQWTLPTHGPTNLTTSNKFPLHKVCSKNAEWAHDGISSLSVWSPQRLQQTNDFGLFNQTVVSLDKQKWGEGHHCLCFFNPMP